MIRKIIICSALFSSLAFLSCGPAAEDRDHMHARAKIISDSMANLIRSAIEEAEMPARPAPVDTSGMKPMNTATAAPTPTSK